MQILILKRNKHQNNKQQKNHAAVKSGERASSLPASLKYGGRATHWSPARSGTPERKRRRKKRGRKTQEGGVCNTAPLNDSPGLSQPVL